MANKPLQSIKFPDLPDTYTIPVVDSTLAVSGAAADAKKTGDSLADKVDKVSGKGLSTNDFTTTEKNKLSGIESGANKTVIDSTLAISGNAADAKAVGDALADVDRNAYGAYIVPTATGPIAHFEDGADNIPMKDVLVHIEPVQAGSGDPSPENVRPITGFTVAKVTRCGKNLFMPAKTTGTTENNGITFTYYEDGSISATGTATADAYSQTQSTSQGWRLPAGAYKKTPQIQVGNATCGLLVQVKVSSSAWKTVGAIAYSTATISEEYAKYDTVARFMIRAGGTVDNLVLNPYIYLASDTDDTYEPYSGTTYSITFPSEAGTVYGGTLDVTKGELVVDRAFKVFNGSENWAFSSISIRPNIRITDMAYKGAIICNMYPYSSEASAIEGTISTNGGDGYTIWIKDSINGDSLVNWKTFLATNNLQVVYELATPITYHLAPQEITSLLGTNNVWADTGDSDVEYRADTKLYITKKITEAVIALS